MGGGGGPDYQGVRTTEGKLRGINNIKISLLSAKVKLLKEEILYLRLHNNSSVIIVIIQ
jgi:hypothetical protein